MENLGVMEVIGISVSAVILVAFCVAFYLRKIQGRSADLKKRDANGRVIG